MTKLWVPKGAQAPLHDELVGNNAAQPSGSAWRGLAESMTYVASRQKKLVLCKMQDMRNVLATSTPPVLPGNIWPCYFRTGRNTSAVRVRAGLARATAGAPYPVYTDVSVKTPAGTTVASKRIPFTDGNGGATVTPADMSHHGVLLEGLSPVTEYRIDISPSQDTAVVYMTITEADVVDPDDSTVGVVSPTKYPIGGPIYDEHGADLIEAANALWQDNGAHLISWTCDYEALYGSPGTRTISGTASWADLGSSYPRFYLPLAKRTTRRSQTVRVKMAVLAERVTGSGTIGVRLTNGTNHVSVTGIGAGSRTVWTTATGVMPAADAMWHLEVEKSSAEHGLYGVSVFPYEA